jgi:hypothetical protein
MATRVLPWGETARGLRILLLLQQYAAAPQNRAASTASAISHPSWVLLLLLLLLLSAGVSKARWGLLLGEAAPVDSVAVGVALGEVPGDREAVGEGVGGVGVLLRTPVASTLAGEEEWVGGGEAPGDSEAVGVPVPVPVPVGVPLGVQLGDALVEGVGEAEAPPEHSTPGGQGEQVSARMRLLRSSPMYRVPAELTATPMG